MGDDRRDNVAGAESGTDASPAPEPREMTGREAELAARTLADRDLTNEPATAHDHDGGDDDVDGRP
ncbi:MAG TPA: hypothetical protein VF092_06010 [Longimicrobium sp.]